MQTFVARQPIFTRELEVIAYELLFRQGLEQQAFAGTDGTQASSSVLSDSFLSIGLKAMTDHKVAFINFTRDLLLMDLATLFSPDDIVVEILEDVEPDPPVTAAVRQLRNQGYLVALDDFEYAPKYDPLIDLANIIKVDFSLSNEEQRRGYVEMFQPQGIRMLAEKVETQEDFRAAKAMGYDYFQGYFFSKPVVLTSERIPENKFNSLVLIKEANKSEPAVDDMEEIIKRDVALTYKLLRYINSAFFGLRNEIHSVRQALTLLGSKNVRKWASLVALSGLAEDQPTEMILASLIRARLCESLAPMTGFDRRDQDLFLLGMFSLLDAMMGMPMKRILEDIPLAEDVKKALLGDENRMALINRAIAAYEAADWPRFEDCGNQIGLAVQEVPDIYVSSVDWAQKIVELGLTDKIRQKRRSESTKIRLEKGR